MSNTPIPLSRLSFPTYIAQPKTCERVWFPSLMHFFEAEKFRLQHPDIYLSIVNSTNLKEVAKIAKRNQSLWRDDWIGVRGRVLLCGMRYAAWADPDPQRWTDAPDKLALELQELGFPTKFSLAAVTEFQRLLANPTWCFFGVDHAPQDVVGKRLNTIHRKCERAWSINHWLGRHTSWRVHDWALSLYIPMRYFGEPRERLTPEHIERLVTASNHACVFEKRGGKAMDATIRQIKGLKAPLEMDFYAPSTLGGQLAL